MLDGLFSLLALLILGSGAYAVLSGSVALFLDIGFAIRLRFGRLACLAVIMIGLGLYLLGNMLLLSSLAVPA